MTPSTLDDSIAAVLAGDRECFRAVIDHCECDVRMVVASILPVRDQLDDVVQETFLFAYRKLADYRQGSDVALWIKAIARNLALNQRRNWLRKRSTHGDSQTRIEQHADPRLEGGLQQLDPSRGAIDECLARLGAVARDVIDAHYWQELSVADIAARQERSPEWVKNVLFRTRAILAACLRARGVGHGA